MTFSHGEPQPRFEITCINKPDLQSLVEHITHVGGYGAGQWKLPVEEVIRRIEGRIEGFFVRVRMCERREVMYRRRRFRIELAEKKLLDVRVRDWPPLRRVEIVLCEDFLRRPFLEDVPSVGVTAARHDLGLTNIKVMIPFCRTVEEGKRVIAAMATHGLRQGDDQLEIYVMCEIPSNVIQAEKFLCIFDGFSIGSNDLTQLILGVDRDSEIVAEIFDERNPAVKKMIADVIAVCRRKGRKIGICGQAPSDYPEFAHFLVEQKIDSISLNPDTVLKTTLAILEKE